MCLSHLWLMHAYIFKSFCGKSVMVHKHIFVFKEFQLNAHTQDFNIVNKSARTPVAMDYKSIIYKPKQWQICQNNSWKKTKTYGLTCLHHIRPDHQMHKTEHTIQLWNASRLVRPSLGLPPCCWKVSTSFPLGRARAKGEYSFKLRQVTAWWQTPDIVESTSR